MEIIRAFNNGATSGAVDFRLPGASRQGEGNVSVAGGDLRIDGWAGPRIKVIGVGGAGSNAVDRMIQMGMPGVEFIAANSDAQALARSEASCKIHLGTQLTRSLGAGGNPALGASAAQESREKLGQALRGADMVFIAAGMGGGTGTGASPVVARVAREEKALTIAIVTKPFSFEGTRRLEAAEEGIARLRGEVDTLIVVPNDRLLRVVDRGISLDVAFRIADEVLRQAVQAVSELVTRPGLINLDFGDVRTIMQRAGGALISIGHGEGEGKAVGAARVALASPLLDVESVSGMTGLLVNITGGSDLTLAEVNQAMQLISQAALPQAEIIFGAVIDPKMEGRAEITLIATGIGTGQPAASPQAALGEVSWADSKAAPLVEERPAWVEVLGEELAIPAFMRSHRLGVLG